MLTIAYIGNGKSTNRYHLPYVLTRETFRVKTIYSRADSSPWARIDGVTYVQDVDAIWDDPEIQLVVVCTRPDSHEDYARAALEHGKHALVEKPFAPSAEAARELFALARERGLFLQCYQNRRFDSDFLTTQRVIESSGSEEHDFVRFSLDMAAFKPSAPPAPAGSPLLDRHDELVRYIDDVRAAGAGGTVDHAALERLTGRTVRDWGVAIEVASERLLALLGRWHETARAEQPVRVTAAGARQEGASGGGFGAEADPDGDLSGTTSAGGGPPASGGFRIRD